MPPDNGHDAETTATAADPERRRPLGRRRLQVLALLEDVGAPMTANEVAQRLGAHENTARFHLDGLAADGLATRSVEEPAGPGRPRVLFTATSGTRATDQRSYRLLAEMLAAFVATQVPGVASASEQAGAAWGRGLAGPPPGQAAVTESDGVEMVVESLRRVGFETHAAPEDGGLRLEISHCPFLEVAARHQEVVCSMHLGLIRGVLEEGRAPLTAESLEPLVEPSRCIAHLRR